MLDVGWNRAKILQVKDNIGNAWRTSGGVRRQKRSTVQMA